MEASKRGQPAGEGQEVEDSSPEPLLLWDPVPCLGATCQRAKQSGRRHTGGHDACLCSSPLRAAPHLCYPEKGLGAKDAPLPAHQ